MANFFFPPPATTHVRPSPTNLGRLSVHGFTLIEVMIVVAVIGILAAIAAPSYNDYIRRGQIPEAFNTLSDFRTKMEQYYQDNRNYGSATACAENTSASSWNSFAPGNAKYFTFGCVTSNTEQGYTITATGVAGQAVGHIYTINQDGNRATTQFKGSAVAASCWLTTTTAC